MADSDKPFVCYKAGLRISITPRTAAGWIALGWWMAAFFLGLGLFGWAISRSPTGAPAAAMVALFVLASVLWSIAMIRWMIARSEVVDMAELMKLKRELDAKKGKRGR